MARVRTEDRRRAILEVASEVFLELGYDRASMSLIAERVGGSKATLYGYFRSKEDLFLGVMDLEIETNVEKILGTMLGEPDLARGLTNVGTAYLMQRLSVRPTRYFRMVSGQSGESEIGKHFYGKVLKPAWMILCRKFEELMAEGRLRKADPWDAAMHFKGLMDFDLVERRLLGAIREGDEKLCREVAAKGVDVFLRAYGPDAPA